MTKLLMIGNSHVAALRLGWPLAAAELPGLVPDLFGAHARNIVNLEDAGGGELRMSGNPFWHFEAGQEPDRATSIWPANYDAVAIVGCDFGPLNVFRTYRRYHFNGLTGRRKQALTRELFRRAVRISMDESAAVFLVNLIRTVCDKPILLLPTPMPAENGYADTEKTSMEPWQAAVEAKDDAPLLAIYDELCQRMRRQGITVIAQPALTLATPMSTLQEYSDDSVRLRADEQMLHPENDYFHMNARYGALMWHEIARVAAALAEQAA